jgi:hypothetical protein
MGTRGLTFIKLGRMEKKRKKRNKRSKYKLGASLHWAGGGRSILPLYLISEKASLFLIAHH